MSQSESHRPFVSVIVPHYDDLSNLARALALLQHQSWPRDRFEIIVADNNSRCGIAGVIETVTRAGVDAVVIPAPEQGAGPARNAAVAVARGEILAFIDSDCFAEAGWMAAGVAALSRFDYVGGQVVTDVPNPACMSPAQAYEAVFAFNFRKYIEQDRFSGTGNLFMPRSLFDAVGPFRSGVSEDKEWCHRANALGFRIGYAAEAVVAHPARRTFAELATKWRRVVSESWLLQKEQRGGTLRWWLRAAATAGSPMVHSARVLRHPRLVGWRSVAKGLVGLFAIRFYRSWLMVRAPFQDYGAAGRQPDVTQTVKQSATAG